MENASKALLIAASVLIAIVLIAVSIRILGSTSGVANEVGNVSKSVEVSIFNSQFTQYEGKQRGSAVNSLIRLIDQNNATNTSRQITKASVPTNIEISKTYTVKFETNKTTGYINKCTITE